MNIFARHGDLVIEKTTITDALEPATDLVLAGGSSGHPHTLRGWCLHRRDGDNRTFVRLDVARTLEHGRADGHQDIALPPGDYEIRRLRERNAGTDRNVED
jgi:hypothetical protein